MEELDLMVQFLQKGLYTFKVENPAKIIRSFREGPPASYLFEIESFKSLTNSILDAPSKYFETTEFEAGGFNWLLSLYPTGNKDDDGGDHISLYLKLVDRLDQGDSIDATFKFFVYDYKRRAYLTVQDLREQCFDEMEKERGISRVLPLSDFTNASNGFLKNDRCKFGVEVFVADTVAKTASLSTLNERSDSTFVWWIQDFSKLSDPAFSNEFLMEGRSWKLKLAPKGHASGLHKSLSASLVLNDATDLTNGKKVYVEHELRLKNFQGPQDTDIARITRAWYSRSNGCEWGTDNLISLSELHDPSKGFLLEDKLILEVKLNLVFLMSDCGSAHT
ncbi:hypothetical protein Nepgr_019997 [Nepenthes gracilis]|uniref:MATH domain-containing protein n=1 Tax=Nepenthes gracilis TaxID=150966 RepID=A0AAD3SY49_NEPGR|nr:hypothetical protein Nepgr_019997 [Nepenthes gracilis]